MNTLSLAGRDIPLVYNMRAMYEMERTLGRIQKVNDDLKGAERIPTIIKLICCMAKGAGETVEESWLWENFRPADFMTAYIQVMTAYSDGMRMEVDVNDGKPVDIGLQEIKKKKAKAD